jgi:hypothetical protein
MAIREEGGINSIARPKAASFTENLLGNYTPVTDDTHNFRAIAIASKDPRFLAVAEEGAEKGVKPFKPQEAFKRGELTIEEALKHPTYWDSAPKANEYGAVEAFQQHLAKQMGTTPADFQGNLWVGAGAHTGLASPGEPFLDTFASRVAYTASRMKVPEKQILTQFIKGEIPLLASGGPLRSGQLSVVGEKGPELFIPRVNGDVVPNHMLRFAAEGAFNPITAPDSTTVVKQGDLTNALEANTRMLKAVHLALRSIGGKTSEQGGTSISVPAAGSTISRAVTDGVINSGTTRHVLGKVPGADVGVGLLKWILGRKQAEAQKQADAMRPDGTESKPFWVHVVESPGVKRSGETPYETTGWPTGVPGDFGGEAGAPDEIPQRSSRLPGGLINRTGETIDGVPSLPGNSGSGETAYEGTGLPGGDSGDYGGETNSPDVLGDGGDGGDGASGAAGLVGLLPLLTKALAGKSSSGTRGRRGSGPATFGLANHYRPKESGWAQFFKIAGKEAPQLLPMFLATGGPVQPGKPYIVGEKGHELFVPSHAGRIIDNRATERMLTLTPNLSPSNTMMSAKASGAYQGRASGGAVSAGSAYVVGERGPETFYPMTSGTVLDHESARRAFGGAGGGNTYIMDNRGTDPVMAEQRTNSGIMAAHSSAVGLSVQVNHDRTWRNSSGR